MRLNLNAIIHTPGGAVPFDFAMDLSKVDFSGQTPIREPVQVKGQVRNQADMLLLEAELQTNLHLICDRCGKHFRAEKLVPLHFVLAEQVADEENDDIILLEDGALDMEALSYDSFILEMDTKHLCSENCKGLCPGCGADLNVEQCRCKKATDPRWAALSQLLDNTE